MKGIRKKRFTKKLNPDIETFLSSIKADERLIAYDIRANRAHVAMLRKQKCISAQDSRTLDQALRDLGKQYAEHTIRLLQAHEDVHMNIEYQVKKHTGNIADKLHMARSRNDLIATDMRLYTRDKVIMLLNDILALQKALIQHARRNKHVIVPGYTHLQRAQPVLWPFYLLSIFFKLQRDIDCLCDAYRRINISCLGACALAGTAHNIDPEYTAKFLGFDRFADNSMDAVGDRDFLCETAYICAQIGLHLAGFAEDIIIYATTEFALLTIDDAIATGSSIMPHKKNPDICEMIRAQAGSLAKHIVALLSVLKGMPSTYNRDLQATKTIIFDCIDTTHACMCVMPVLISHLHLNQNEWAYGPAFCCATNVVDYAAAKNQRFRKAYHIVSACACQAQGDITVFMRLCAQRLHIPLETIKVLLTPRNAVQAKQSGNSTGPGQVNQALIRAQNILKKNKQRIARVQQAKRKK